MLAQRIAWNRLIAFISGLTSEKEMYALPQHLRQLSMRRPMVLAGTSLAADT